MDSKEAVRNNTEGSLVLLNSRVHGSHIWESSGYGPYHQ